MIKRNLAAIGFTIGAALSNTALADELTLNEEKYFEQPGVNVLVFSNWYNGLFSDSKMSGVEIIHHGERSATNGDVRLNATPEQWDMIPQFVKRKVNEEEGTIEAFLRYPNHDFDFSIRVQASGESAQISVHLPKPLPSDLEGVAGFNMEFIPSMYSEHSFLMDGRPGVLPIYPSGPKEVNGVQQPVPMATGKHLVLAPENDKVRVSIKGVGTELSLYDGRNKAQNGWYVVRSLIPAEKTGKVLQWELTPNAIDGWVRDPVITHSQVGYHPSQKKQAVIELDANDSRRPPAKLLRINASGKAEVVKQAKADPWGQYTRYDYVTFDFSDVTDPGVYQLQYGDQVSDSFRIGRDVYANVWHPTLDIFFPVQMDHVLVNEAYRVWHGASHLDDALQAPVDHVHFDLYAQGPTTDTEYEPGEHIPGLNIGGWYDAGDYDIRTQTQYRTVTDLVAVWEMFDVKRDTTTVNYADKFVDLHVADGKPDLQQQIEHGTLGLIAQHRTLGRAIPGIIVPDISQYTHLGDGLTMTDNLIYDPSMGPLESDGYRSGKFDDRWAFTSRSSALNYGSIAALAAASRALKGHNDDLAQESLQTAIAAWDEEQTHEPYTFRHGNTTGGPLEAEQLKAAVELLVTTGDQKYADAVNELLPEIEKNFGWHAKFAVRAIPFMDEVYRAKMRQLTMEYVAQLDELEKANPFGVRITEGGWAGNGTIISMAVTNYYLYKVFPDLVDKEDVYSGLNYIFGTHPDSSISFVSAVGTRSKKVAYGMNRADYSYIPGGVVPGVLILKPDFPENREDWPFLWGENEYVINVGASYLFLANAVEQLLKAE